MAGIIHEVSMPKWGMEMSEGAIAGWNFAVGDAVNQGDDLVEIETAKILNTLSAHDSGVLRRILAAEGETCLVGALIAIITEGDVSEAEIDAVVAKRSGGAQPAAAEPAPAVAAAPVAAAPAAAASATGNTGVSVVARRIAAAHGIDTATIAGTGRNGRVSKADVERAIERAGGSVDRFSSTAPRPAGDTRDDSGVNASPVARRLARELGVNLLDCRASGRHGRVSKEDVEAAHALAGRSAPAAAAPVAAAVAAPSVVEQPLTGMRKTIAARLQASKQGAPHYRVSVDVELDELLAVRRQINDANPAARVSVNDMLVKACALALVKVPDVNIQFDGTTIRRFADADIAVAVAIDGGLITPVVRRANALGLAAIAAATRDLAERARGGKLRPDEYQGGTFSISNLGMHGVRQFDAIINPPQAAILAVGSAEQRPVVRDGALAIATVMTLSLSSDHRVIDGALAAEFLRVLKGFLQKPATMLA